MKQRAAKVDLYSNWKLRVIFLVLFVAPNLAISQYRILLTGVEKDSASIQAEVGLNLSFKTRAICETYIRNLPELLQLKGYAAASIDSLVFDSGFVYLQLFLGEKYQWAKIDTDSIEPEILQAVKWYPTATKRKSVDFSQLYNLQQRLLDYHERNGYPFARILVDSFQLAESGIHARLRVDKGPLYKIDSIRNLGNANISSNFLQRYLGIANASIYRKDRLEAINQRLLELPYLRQSQPWNMTLLGTGSIVNLHLEPQRSSQINVLIGLLPANEQLKDNKMLVTGEATINLKNALGAGETIGLNWQQVQVKSPRLDLIFQQPYLFSSPFGARFNFNLFKKDSSFLSISMLAGLQFSVSAKQTGTLFIQNITSNLLSVDTFLVKNTRRLPDESDLRSLSLGVDYQLAATDYRFNPRRGNEFNITATVGTKNIRKNGVIGKLYDPGFDFGTLYDTLKLKSYQFRLRLDGAHYFSLNRVSTVKVGANGGWFQSPSIFRNELFQIGGYKLLRGFDEESIFASEFVVGTVEYRYLIGANSFMFAFFDYGWAKNRSSNRNLSNTFLGTGLGIALETKAGIFNMSLASGKRDDTKLNLRQSKIHIGYVNYF